MHAHPAALVLTLDAATLAHYRQSAEHLGLRAPDLASALLTALAPMAQGLPALDRYGPDVRVHVVPTVGAVAFSEHEASLPLAPLYQTAHRAQDQRAAGASLHTVQQRSAATRRRSEHLMERAQRMMKRAQEGLDRSTRVPSVGAPGVEGHVPEAPALAAQEEADLPAWTTPNGAHGDDAVGGAPLEDELAGHYVASL